MLESLEKMNLLSSRLTMNGTGTCYHHLFADVLKKAAGNSIIRIRRPAASACFSLVSRQNGLIPEPFAITYIADDHRIKLFQLIEQNGPLLILGGKLNSLSG